MRFLWLVLLVACTHTVKDGEKVVVGDGDHVVVGSVRIDVVSRDDTLYLHMFEGASAPAVRRVAGLRDVKFGAHRVKFEETGSNVAITVRAYKASSPLTSVDALFAADEIRSASTVGMSDCTTATLSADGKSYVVTCSDTDVANSARPITVDAVTGAILSM